MIKTKIYNQANKPKEEEKNAVTGFLFEHLEQYGDKQEDIAKAISYALQEQATPGGFVVTAHNGSDDIAAAAVVNRTGMDGYIPGNILVYIATHKDQRGKGIANKVMDVIIELADGDIALHVEPDNPAINLYKKYGFTNKYLEMRLLKPTK
jgi:ribosomal protein S18 acetylase RimI-like enzyme